MGIFSELPTSATAALMMCSYSNAPDWSQAEHDPALIRTLLDKEISAGHVVAFEGDRKAAAKHWPQRVAIGKLNIVIAEGRDPRLVLDSTACNAHTLPSMSRSHLRTNKLPAPQCIWRVGRIGIGFQSSA